MDTIGSKDLDQKNTDTGRRSFMWKVGAGVSAVMAATIPAIARPVFNGDKNKTRIDSLAKQVAVLEEEKLIREIHGAYEDLLDKGLYNDVPDMFTDDAEVIFNGGVFKGKNKGVNRLFCNYFKSGLSGKRIDPAPGFESNTDKMPDAVELSADLKSAKAKFAYSIQVGSPIESDSLLVKMARLQGEGIQRWWEGGTYELSYVKDIKNGNWKIKRLEYRTLSRADYKPGRTYAKAISVPVFSDVYPKNPDGPDKLI